MHTACAPCVANTLVLQSLVGVSVCLPDCGWSPATSPYCPYPCPVRTAHGGRVSRCRPTSLTGGSVRPCIMAIHNSGEEHRAWTPAVGSAYHVPASLSCNLTGRAAVLPCAPGLLSYPLLYGSAAARFRGAALVCALLLCSPRSCSGCCCGLL